jgi:hypothetical protein
MKTIIVIYEGQQVTSGGGVYNLIYAREWIRIFRTCLIEIGVVDAHLKLPVSLWDNDQIGQPH